MRPMYLGSPRFLVGNGELDVVKLRSSSNAWPVTRDELRMGNTLFGLVSALGFL